MNGKLTVVAVVSPKGGVGKTTLAANIAASLAASGRRVWALDMDPQNALRLHFHMPFDLTQGVAVQALQQLPLEQAAYSSPQGVNVLPYGTLAEGDRRNFEYQLTQQPRWLAEQLDQLPVEWGTVIVIDTPPGGSIYLQQALSAANLALLVLLPDAASYVTIPSMERWLDEYSRGRSDFRGAYYLVNRMNPARVLCRDVLSALQRELDGVLVPQEVHFDAAVEEALASQLPVARYAPESAAARDIHLVSNWLAEKL